MPKLYIAHDTCSRTVQIVANELGLGLELIHYDVFAKTTSSRDNFLDINPLAYVPALVLDNPQQDILTETVVISTYLADQHPDSDLAPTPGTLKRTKFDQLLSFLSTEIAQKHIPLIHRLMTEEGTTWGRHKLQTAYGLLNQRLFDGRPFLTGEQFTVADAYVFGTWWHARSGVKIGHLSYLMAYKVHMEARPSLQKALKDEAMLVAQHRLLATV
ncbi:glutathione S-transferase [Pseudoduganella sp. FT25W]|uniref:Glutathione S-transferase n=1 Tax=Duganella alba TaxID=2666081 RepID=A0A6L5QD04_9BURK|nr:glutathione S-transferase N-terminal domain-containing protein [Duganella alba]MRX07162.1 glutathione S-transferase [Duganella alba]MRX15143.1 glutathione S-transferase [Duganella alba]